MYPLILIVTLIVAYLLETKLFALAIPANRGRHAVRNLAVGLVNLICIASLGAVQLRFASTAPAQWWMVACYVLLLDLVNYLIHRSLHAAPILRRLHRCHHSDPYLDATSTFRFHFLESVYRFAIFTGVTWLLAIPQGAIVAYQLWVLLALVASHTNIRLPSWTENTLGLVLVLPTQHRVHHDKNRELHDSNFSIGFMFWDRILGTYSKVQDVDIGLAGYDSDADQTALAILSDPFRKLGTYD
jgi:sterol desaturase/sphingolipid hydroxylase (fatty acid hydroxylase superfamily)